MSNEALLEKVLSSRIGEQIALDRQYEQARAAKLEAIRQIQALGSDIRRHLGHTPSTWLRDDAVMQELRSLREAIEELNGRLR